MFAIMNATGQFLPGGGRGGTWREFGEGPARLFTTRASAESALRWWFGGPGRMIYRGEDDIDDFYQDPSSIRKGQERQAISSTIKVVEVELVVV